jgi:adenylate cyclase
MARASLVLGGQRMLASRYMQKHIPFALFGVALLLATPRLAAEEPRPIVPLKGRVNLAALGPGSMAKIDGEWEFFWRRFVAPSRAAAEGTAGAAPSPDAYAIFPGEWKDYPIPGIEPLGYGTYRLRLEGLDSRVDWALKLSSVLSACRLYANGRLVAALGEPGTDAASERPEWDSLVVRLGPPEDGAIDLVLQISNFADRSGGSRTSLIAGDYEAIAGLRARARLEQIFLFGAILMMGLYYLCLFLFRPRDRSTLFFGLLCLALAVRVVCYDEYCIRLFWPSLPWLWLFRLGYLMFSLPVFFFAGYLRSSYPRFFAKAAFLGITALCAAYSALFALAPTLLMSKALASFQIVTLATGLYSVYVLARAVVGRLPGAIVLSMGFVLFFAAAVHDILSANGIVRGPFLVQAGLLLFLFSMSIVITRTFAGAFAKAEALSEELARGNKAMRRFVPGEFLSRLGKSSIEQVSLGDHADEEMTVLFADIRHFSSLSEKMAPEDTFKFINQYLARVSPAIRSHGGFVDKYLGDGIMALFPGSPEDAVRCAIDIHHRLGDYNLTRSSIGEAPIRVGIGVHCGRLMLGTIGEAERMDGTVISDAVNTASRIEGISKEYEIGVSVSERVLVGLEDPSVYRTRFLGKVGVKGKREPVSVFEVYDGDPEPLRDAKDRVRPTFERAIASFYDQDYARALELFKTVLERLPEDEASHHYVRIIRKLKMA